MDDLYRQLRTTIAVGVLTFGGGLGFIFMKDYGDRPAQLVIAIVGVASGVAAVVCLASRDKRKSTQWLWLALALFAAYLVIIVIVYNFWPPVFPRTD